MTARHLLLSLFCLATLGAAAQVQQGRVRTISRPGRPAQPVAGATVSILGLPNAVVSDARGTFSFSRSGKKEGDAYTLMRVQKRDYELVDKGMVGRRFGYSSAVPLEIIMVSVAQKQADMQKIEERANQRAQQTYQKQIEELEQLRTEKQITEERYNQLLVELGDKYQNYLTLIEKLAERYAKTDYEGISDINRRILQAIEEADLERADSLIDSKGSFDEREQRLRERVAMNQKTAELLQQSQQAEERDRQDLADDYYNKYTILSARFQNDSAAAFLYRRAALDTTCVEWQLQAGLLGASAVADYQRAIGYYHCALRHSAQTDSVGSENAATAYWLMASDYEVLWQLDVALDYYQRALALIRTLYDANSAEMGMCYYGLASVYRGMGRYPEALENAQRALELEHDASEYNLLGGLYYDMGQYDQALDHYQQALQMSEAQDSAAHSVAIATLWQNIGDVYGKKGDHRKALDYTLRALQLMLRIRGHNHPTVASAYGHAGECYTNLNEYDAAEDCFRQSYDISRAIFGEDHPDVGMALRSLGELATHRGNLEQALQYQRRALSVFQKTLGEMSPETAHVYVHMGNTYQLLSDYPKAMECLGHALAIRQSLLDANHPDLAAVYLQMGNISIHRRQWAEAEDYFQHALDIRRKAFGEQSASVASCYEDLSKLCWQTERTEQAVDYASKAVAIMQAVDEHGMDMAHAYNTLSGAYSASGDYQQALQYQQQALTLMKQTLGEEHFNTATIYRNIGDLYLYMSDYVHAEPYILRSLELLRKALGDRHESVGRCYLSLTAVQSQKGDYAAALDYDVQAISILRERLGDSHPELAQYYDYAVRLCKQLGDASGCLRYLTEELHVQQAAGASQKDISQTLVQLYNTSVRMAEAADPESPAAATLRDVLRQLVFVARVDDDGDYEARRQGLDGEYLLLGYGDWRPQQPRHLLDVVDELRDQPKDVILLRQGQLLRHHFEGVAGLRLSLRMATPDELQQLAAHQAP